MPTIGRMTSIATPELTTGLAREPCAGALLFPPRKSSRINPTLESATKICSVNVDVGGKLADELGHAYHSLHQTWYIQCEHHRI